MSDIIPVQVLAPVHHIPPRSRVSRLTYAPVDIRVPLRELGQGEHVPGPAIPTPGGKVIRTRLVDGALWRPVRKDDGNGMDPRKAVTADELRSWLSGSPEQEYFDTRDVARCFSATPLVARLPHLQGMLRVRGTWDETGAGEILSDARARAARIGSEYVTGSVALLSGVPHVRMRGPLCYLDATNGLRRVLRHPHAATTSVSALHALPFRVDHGAAQAAFERAYPISTSHADRDWRDEWDAGLFDGIDTSGDYDIDLFIADGMRLLLDNLDSVRKPDIPHAPPRLARMRAASGLASVGLVEPEERGDLLDLIVAAAREQDGTINVFRQCKAARFVAFAREVAHPRLAPPAPEDVEALALVSVR